MYGWGRKAFLGVLDEGNYYRPEKLKFEKCLKIAAGAEHILLLAEKAEKNETVLLDQSIDDTLIITEAAKGETILEEALVKTVQIEEKTEKKVEQNSLSKNLVKSVNWIGQSTINMLPSHVTNVISSTISLTGSGISGTLSTAERLVSAISELINQKSIEFQIDDSIGLPGGPCALTELWSWGRNSENQLGSGDGIDHIEPLKMTNLSTKGLIAVFAKDDLSLAISSTWDVHMWGKSQSG